MLWTAFDWQLEGREICPKHDYCFKPLFAKVYFVAKENPKRKETCKLTMLSKSSIVSYAALSSTKYARNLEQYGRQELIRR